MTVKLGPRRSHLDATPGDAPAGAGLDAPHAATVEGLPPDRDQFEELAGWVLSAAPSSCSLLDVGGGGGFYDFPALLRDGVERMVGVDPDPGVERRPWFDEAHTQTVEEYAPESHERFDVATCVYVVEHVEDPPAFLHAVHHLLRPGGSCFGVTPNLWHYFGLTSAVTSRAHLDEWLLHKLRSEELIEEYHSPLRYRMNSASSLCRMAYEAGFRDVEFRSLEQAGMFETYFPDRLRWWPRAYSGLLNKAGWSQLFGTLLFRLRA